MLKDNYLRLTLPAGQILPRFLVRPLLAMSKLMDNHTDGGPDKAEAHHPI